MGQRYLAPYGNGFHIIILKHAGNVYRPYTNQVETYFKFIENLPYFKTEKEAQDLLDDLAKKNHWKPINDKRYFV